MLTCDLMLRDIVTAKKGITARDCIDLLFKRHVGTVIIVDEKQRCVGIFTERDAIRIIAQDLSIDEPIEKVMTRHVYTVSEDTPFIEAKKIMKLHKIRHIPVTDSDGKLVGLLSIRHILDTLLGMP